MYVVPEDLRQDLENYRENIDRNPSNPAVLYRYSRRKINNHVAIFAKIFLAIGIGFAMLFALCKLTESSGKVQQSAKPTMQQKRYRTRYAPAPATAGQAIYVNNPIAYQTRYVQVPIYDANTNQTYLIWQPVQNYTYR